MFVSEVSYFTNLNKQLWQVNTTTLIYIVWILTFQYLRTVYIALTPSIQALTLCYWTTPFTFNCCPSQRSSGDNLQAYLSIGNYWLTGQRVWDEKLQTECMTQETLEPCWASFCHVSRNISQDEISNPLIPRHTMTDNLSLLKIKLLLRLELVCFTKPVGDICRGRGCSDVWFNLSL